MIKHFARKRTFDVSKTSNFFANSMIAKFGTNFGTNRKLNVIAMKEMIETQVPDLLTTNFDKKHISNNIVLRICPQTHPFIPITKGKYAYNTVVKTVQFALSSFVLHPSVKLHVISIAIKPPVSELPMEDYLDSVHTEQLEKQLIDEIAIFYDPSSAIEDVDRSSLFPWTYKIEVKWRTCFEECVHLQRNNEFMSTSNAKCGSYSINMDKSVYTNMNAVNLNEQLRKMITPLTSKKQRYLQGTFLFELNLNNNKILIHNVQDVEMIEDSEPEPSLKKLATY